MPLGIFKRFSKRVGNVYLRSVGFDVVIYLAHIMISRVDHKHQQRSSNLNGSMVSLERCRELMKRHECAYTDEQLLKIRDFLYQLAAIEFKVYQRKINENEKGDHLYESVLRRAS